MSLLSELKRRNVLRVGAAYLVFAWLLVQVVETIFPAFGFGDEAVRLVVLAAAIGFVPALILVWVFEITPSGIRLDADSTGDEADSRRPTPILDRVIVVVLVAAVGFFAVDKFIVDPKRDTALEEAARQEGRSEAFASSYDMGSIAVLPFVNMSADEDNAYFCDGMAEELLNLLARVEGLRVISRSSSFAYRDRNIAVPDIAKQLDVALVLEGSVRKFGNQIRVTAQLIEARSDTHLWSETYDRDLDNVFAIQDEISGAIVTELRSRLGVAAGNAPAAAETNQEAYDAYLRGRYLTAQRTPESWRAAVEQFTEALALDEDYAPAHAELSMALLIAGVPVIDYEVMKAKARHHATRAVSLDPDLPEAHAAKGILAAWHDGDQAAGEKSLERALELNPNYAQVQYWLADMNDSPAAVFEDVRKTVILDPLSLSGNMRYIDLLIDRGRLEEAAERIARFELIEPRGSTVALGMLESLDGNWSAWVLRYLEAAGEDPDTLVFGKEFRWKFALHLRSLRLDDEARAVFPDDLAMRRLTGQAEAVERELRRELANGAINRGFTVQLAFAQSFLGLYEEAHATLEDVLWERRPKIFRRESVNVYEELYLARVAVGDDQGAAQLLETVLSVAAAYRSSGVLQTRTLKSTDWLEGAFLHLSGQIDEGIALMARAASDGYSVLDRGALHERRMREPRYREIIELQRERAARERAKVLEVVCAPVNPYANAWQPLPETCEDFRG